MDFQVRELRVGDPEDAARLAALWNASDTGWPGGITRGIPETAASVGELKARQHRLAVFVCQSGDEIIGYADLEQLRQGVGLLPLLNVRPDWHGRGCGKALILAVLEAAIARGFRQLDLWTWAGNLKAVPLYKKTGFFWRPETTVLMQNFIPTALAAPLGQSFFASYPWYPTFRRELAVEPDETRWHGVRVYPYRFEADGRLFAMWIDGVAERPTAYETEDVFVACYLGREEIVCGVEQTVTWEVVNKRPGRPLQAAILARGSEGVALNVSEAASVGDRWVCTRGFHVSPTIPLLRPGRPRHAVESTILLDGVPVELAAGVDAAQPIEIETSAGYLVAGKPERLRLTLRNRLDHDVRAEVRVAPRTGLELEPASAAVTVPASSWSSLEVLALANDEGDLSSVATVALTRADNPHLALCAERVTARPVTLGLRTVPLTGSYHVYHAEDEKLTVETPDLSLSFWLRDCHGSVRSPLIDADLLHLSTSQLGPPFLNHEPVPELTEWRLREVGGAPEVTLVDRPSVNPGVRLEKSYLISGPRLRVTHRIFNETGTPQRLGLRVPAWSVCRDAIAVPLRDGLLYEPLGEGLRPAGGRDIPKPTTEFAESWLAMEGDGVVVGVVWTAATECNNVELQMELPELPPHGMVEAAPFYYVVGPGDWRHVRRLWRWLQQPGEVREELPPTTVPALEVGFEPSPLLLAGPTAATLRIEHRRAEPLDLHWQATAEGVGLEPSGGEVHQVDRERPAAVAVGLETGDARAAQVAVRVEGEALRREWSLPAIVVGRAAAAVEVARDDDLIRVDNGCLQFAVAGQHYGAVVSLVYAGQERLHSSYPTPRPFRWFNPWYGGLLPRVAHPGDQRFAALRFGAEPVERQGSRGLRWRGVRVACEVAHRDYTWLRVEQDYLTTGESNLLCIAQRAVNQVAAPRRVELGIGVWTTSGRALHYQVSRPQPGAHNPGGRWQAEAATRLMTASDFGSRAGRWAAVETDDGLVITAVAPLAGGVATGGERAATGEGTSGLNSTCTFALGPHETRERLHWVAMAADADQARRYACLAELAELP